VHRPIRRPIAILLALGFAVAGCGEEDGLTPQDDLDFFVGDWEAEELSVSSRPDPGQPGDTVVTVDLIDAGSSFRINIQPSGQYTATLTFLARPVTEIGTLEIDGDQITFFRDFPLPDTASGTVTQLSADRILLLGETAFDFDLDGSGEEADLRSELVRQ
jgi:hypothetical protein